MIASHRLTSRRKFAMANRRKVWMYCPPKPPKPKVPDQLREQVSAKAMQLIEEHLRPDYIESPPEIPPFNYIIDIFTRWYRRYFCWCATDARPRPNAMSPTLESCFARMGYDGDGKFNLSCMRHTGKWWQDHSSLTLEACLNVIRDYPIFAPPR